MVGQASRIAMAEFDYELPAELIAQEPLAERSASRLMVIDRSSGEIAHRSFRELPDLLQPDDLLVVNDSRVIPARLIGRRESGAEVELLLLREASPRRWVCLMRPARRLRPGESIQFVNATGEGNGVPTATVVEKYPNGQGLIELDDELAGHLEAYGKTPLPPYIRHEPADPERYQTVYGTVSGSAAAPTAGLHFDERLLQAIGERGIYLARVTLHVGLDTFRPVTAEYAEDHEIHTEWCSVPLATAEAVGVAKRRGGRVIAVGTTAARTLETFGREVGQDEARSYQGLTDIYITPGYRWTVVDAMVTNFHLPRSTLLLMMSAFAGKELLMEAYQEAIRERYRFFSFGDAMLVL